jgi:3-oxoacyl-[acyl-carrier protein] reductase
MMSLRGKTAVVTGASRGIGLAIAESLAREGVNLALLSRTSPPKQVEGKFIQCDLADLANLPDVVTQALGHLGSCDYLINNAGIFLEKSVAETSDADWDQIMRINLTAPFIICREVLRQMIARKSGRIINIASTASVQAYLHQSAYCASKHGLLGFSRGLAIEAKPHNVHVYTLCPGGVDTDLIKGTYLESRMAKEPKIAPADIAETVLFLLRQPENIDLPELIVRRFVPK